MLLTHAYPFQEHEDHHATKAIFKKTLAHMDFLWNLNLNIKRLLKFVQFSVKAEECRKISFKDFHMYVFGILKLIRKRLLRALALLKSLSIKI